MPASNMMNPKGMMKEHPDLAILFEIASRNPSNEELESEDPVLEPVGTIRVAKVASKRAPRPEVPSGLGGTRG